MIIYARYFYWDRWLYTGNSLRCKTAVEFFGATASTTRVSCIARNRQFKRAVGATIWKFRLERVS